MKLQLRTQITSVTAAAFALAMTQAGCRFGNRVEHAPNPDQISGYYATQPQTLTFCADNGTTQCVAASPTDTPAMVTSVMTDPVALVTTKKPDHSAVLVGTDGHQATMNIFADPSGKLSYLGSSSPETLWNDPACTTQLYLEQEGAFARSSTPKMQSGVAISGNIELRLLMTQTFDGDCAQTLQDLRDCYLDVSLCGGSDVNDNEALQSSIHDLFNPYIQSGAMSAADIATLTAVAYEVQYK